MASLRAYLMVCIKGEWSVSVHKELDTLTDSWKARTDVDAGVGVVHFGFERPASQEFSDLARSFPGKVLLTSSAKFGLPAGFQASENEVGQVANLPIYLALRGWGYLLEDDIKAPSKSNSPRAPTGWVSYFLSNATHATPDFEEVGIWNDDDYLRYESRLPLAVRKEAGVFRFEQLIGADRRDPCAFARASPPWLAEREFASIPVSVRVSNVLLNREIDTVFDLGELSLDNLLHTQNFGRKSAYDLVYSLEAALQEGPLSVIISRDTSPSDLNLIQCIESSLLKYPPRARDIMLRRMGFGQKPETLQEIGERYEVSRERIRQIEAKFTKRLIKEEIWDDVLSAKMAHLLEARRIPMPVQGIEAADPWFAGIDNNAETFRYLLDNVSQGPAKIVAIDGVEYVGFLDQGAWDRTVLEARRFLESGVNSGWSLDHCRSMIDAKLSDNCSEFREMLWDAASRQCQFVETDGIPTLVSFGRSAESIIQAVLAESNRPLHYSEIAELARQRSGKDFDIRRAHNAAANIGFLFGRGTYGLRQHVSMSPEQLKLLAQEAEEIVAEGAPGRQWHSQEIAAALVERETGYSSKINKYLVDIALKESGQLENLGRLVWSDAASRSDGESQRIDVRQAVMAILNDAGGPLKTEEIRQRVSALRGVDRNFQFASVDPIMRIDPGIWGLNDRDLVIKRPDQPKVLDALATLLGQRKTGVHFSELENSPSLKALGLSATAFFSLATTDPRFRVNVHRYLYLQEWGAPRRESIAEAVKGLMDAADAPQTFESIVGLAEARMGRGCDRSAVSACLQSLDAVYDQTAGTWRLPIANDADQDSELPRDWPADVIKSETASPTLI
ncbi:hypothetical protein NKI25_32865 [Mesorhizobium sp. M0808]|uniref:sigma factor-like helix-turn-helix DNA-binding protein n=1 Tax=Mesorhizobium sp. M0808 TaxID=2957002 RepID=UPI00333A313F